MNKVKEFSKNLLFLYFIIFSIASSSQSNKVLINAYDTAREKASKIALEKNEKRMLLFQSMDSVPRMVWGAFKPKFINKKQFKSPAGSYLMNLYDYDDDGVADNFVLQTSEGKELNREFGFAYDLNKDGKTDYIVFNGGFMVGKNNEFYYFFYHWIDTNYDGKIDTTACKTYINPGDSLPDSNIIIWVMDTNNDDRPDLLDCINIQNGKINPLQGSLGIWEYNTLFGHCTVKSNDSNYFNKYTEYLRALNDL